MALPAIYTNENIAASVNQTYLRSVVHRVEVNIALSPYLVGSVAGLTASSIFRVNVGMCFTDVTAITFYPQSAFSVVEGFASSSDSVSTFNPLPPATHVVQEAKPAYTLQVLLLSPFPGGTASALSLLLSASRFLPSALTLLLSFLPSRIV